MSKNLLTTQDAHISSTHELRPESPNAEKDKFRILIAVEKHEWSDYAFLWSINYLLNPEKHRVYLLTVTKDSPQAAMIYSASVDGGVPATTLGDIHSESIKKAFTLLREYYKLLHERFEDRMIDCHCLIGAGDPRDEICQTVKKVRADLLILGQQNSGWMKRLVFGSTGDYCTRNAHCAVLIVRDSPLPPINYEHPDALAPCSSEDIKEDEHPLVSPSPNTRELQPSKIKVQKDDSSVED